MSALTASSDLRPSFFLVGAPRCGTTALSEYLRQHPRIAFSDPKEPFFFCDDFAGLRTIERLEDYLTLFRGVRSDTLATGEGSTLYLASNVALERIAGFAPDARVIALVRDPVALARSFHAHLCYNQMEDVDDFETAWHLQEKRARGDTVPRLVREPKMLQYREIARLGTQLERLHHTFAADRILTLFHEDLLRQPRQTYERVLAFLGVPSDGRSEFPRVNARAAARSRRLARLTQHPPQPLVRLAKIARRVLRRPGLSFLAPLRVLNRIERPLPPLRAGFHRDLESELAPEVRRVASLTGRDLSHWLSPHPPDESESRDRAST